MTILVLDFLKAHWPKLSLACAILFIFLYVRQSGELAGCRANLEAKSAELTQIQASKATAGANTALRGKISLPPCPPAAKDGEGKCPPCEAVTIDFEGIANAYAEGAADQASKVKLTPPVVPSSGNWGLWGSYAFRSNLLSIGPSYKTGLFSLGAGISKPVNDQIFNSLDGLEPSLFIMLGPF